MLRLHRPINPIVVEPPHVFVLTSVHPCLKRSYPSAFLSPVAGTLPLPPPYRLRHLLPHPLRPMNLFETANKRQRMSYERVCVLIF